MKEYYDFYTVKEGESIFVISKKFNISVKTLMDMNNVENNRRLKVGQILRII